MYFQPRPTSPFLNFSQQSWVLTLHLYIPVSVFPDSLTNLTYTWTYIFFKHPMLWKTSSLCLLSPWCILRIPFQAVFEGSYILFFGIFILCFMFTHNWVWIMYGQLTTAQILLHVSQSTASRAYMISIYSLMVVILITLSMCGPYFQLRSCVLFCVVFPFLEIAICEEPFEIVSCSSEVSFIFNVHNCWYSLHSGCKMTEQSISLSTFSAHSILL